MTITAPQPTPRTASHILLDVRPEVERAMQEEPARTALQP